MKVIINQYIKEGKRVYELKCGICNNIQITPHLDYLQRKCMKCIALNPLNSFYNGSHVYERIDTLNKFEPVSYKIKCHCNKIFTIRRDTLRNNINKDKKIQCRGCISKDNSLLNREDIKNNQVTTLFERYSKNAKNRGYSFNLSIEIFKNLIEKPCYYCGAVDSDYSHKTIKYLKINGIDRVNNDVGYELDNCVSCCKICNIMKQTLSEEIFLNHIDKIFKFQNKNNGTKL